MPEVRSRGDGRSRSGAGGMRRAGGIRGAGRLPGAGGIRRAGVRSRRADWPNGPRRRSARRSRARRWIAAVVAGLAGFFSLSALSPRAAGGAGVATVVMVGDVAAGDVVKADDVDVVGRPSGHRPVTALSALDEVVGRVAAGRLVAREVVTRERLVGSGLLAGQPSGHVAMSVPVLDVSTLDVGPGSRIDLYSTGTGQLVAGDVIVLGARDAREAGGLGAAAPPQVTLALSPTEASDVARSLTALEAGQIFVVAIRHGSSGSQ